MIQNEQFFSRYFSTGSLLGMLVGIILAMITPVAFVDVVMPYTEIFTRLWLLGLLLIAVPLVVTGLLTSLSKLWQSRMIGKLMVSGIAIHVGMLSLAAAVSVAFSVLFLKIFDPASSGFEQAAPTSHVSFALTQQLLVIQMWVIRFFIPAILLTIFMTVAVNFFSTTKKRIENGATILSAKLLIGLRYILLLLPVSIAGLAWMTTVKHSTGLIGFAGYYISGVCLVLILFILVQYGAVWSMGHTSLKKFAQALQPAQWVAATTCSSLATMPTLESSLKRSGIAPEVTGLTVPVFISLFRVNLLVANPFSFFLLSHLYNLPVELPNVLLFTGMMMLTSFGSPGLPQTGNVYSLPVFLAAGIPMEGVILVKALDAVPDVFKTVLNVTETATVTSLAVRAATYLRLAKP